MLTLSEDPEKLTEQLLEFFQRYSKEIAKAEPLFELAGRRLEELCRNLPMHQHHYSQLAEEAKQLVKWLDNNKSRIEARLTRNYLQGQRAYAARETSTLINGEREMVEQNQLIIEASLCHQRLSEIVESLKQMAWMLGHMTKLRVASIQDAII